MTRLQNALKHYACTMLLLLGLFIFNNNLFAQTTQIDSLTNETGDPAELVLMFADKMPEFKNGGAQGQMNFLKNNIKYPGDSAEGKVIAQFIVDTTGKPTSIKIIRSLSELADKEVVRVVSLMEFTPGYKDGKKVRVRMTLPVSFVLNKKK